ncbi:6-phosphofructokinase [Candidatus Riflebacteria bacterium]
MTLEKIGVITSGGDCGGLNAVVKGAALTASHYGIKTFVIPNGYAGLYNLVHMGKLVELNYARIDTVDVQMAGSDAGHSRVKIAKIQDEGKYERIKSGLDKHRIDCLLIAGGDDTGSVVVDLHNNGINCIHLPKTMDLDLQTYSVGGDSAINRITDFANDLKTTGRTHNRIMVLEIFGRYFGHTAYRGGLAASADAILIPEIPVNFDVLYEHIFQTYTRRISSSDVKAGTYLIVVSEGIKSTEGEHLTDASKGTDAFGHKILGGAGEYVTKQISQRLKEDERIKKFMQWEGMFVEGQYESPEVRNIRPTHLVRCGFTSSMDVNFGLEAGASAVHLIRNGITGVTVVEVKGNKIRYMPTIEAIKPRSVDIETVAFFEKLGICFGRKAEEFNPQFEEYKGEVERIY